ncbi:hypothetical protein DPMN_091484 [Dreissena polymorpha]|uniref:Uncharacterized protein n=1 Tax=Dreissena polymorpha TaxID=45954 RepID=A0A9D4QZ59_DREPO|nr:hypothetical protein DPMN_091484 [Dreissena polymorpha]
MPTEIYEFVESTQKDGPSDRSLDARNNGKELQLSVGTNIQSEVKDSVHLAVNNSCVHENARGKEGDHSGSISDNKDQKGYKNIVTSDDQKEENGSNIRFKYCEREVCKALISLESHSDDASQICFENIFSSCKNLEPACHVTALAVDLPLTNLGTASTEMVLIFH